MNEAVIFPNPEEVTIVATRNGELTQIAGTEFRAPVAPRSILMTTSLFNNAVNNADGVSVDIFIQDDSWVKPIAIYKEVTDDATGLKVRTCFGTIPETNPPVALGHAMGHEIRGLVKQFGDVQPPEKNQYVYVLCEVFGNTIIEEIGAYTASALLAPAYNSRVIIKVYSKLNPNQWGFEGGE